MAEEPTSFDTNGSGRRTRTAGVENATESGTSKGQKRHLSRHCQGFGGTVGRKLMRDNIMFIPALVLAVAEIVALVVMVRGWRKDRRVEDEKSL